MVDNSSIQRQLLFSNNDVVIKKSQFDTPVAKKGTLIAINNKSGNPPFLCSVKWEGSDSVDIVWSNDILKLEEYLEKHADTSTN